MLCINGAQCLTASVMPDTEVPIDIERFLDRLTLTCSEPEFVHSRQETLCKWVTEMADAYPDGRELLRNASLRRLADADARMIERALSCLFVVGARADVTPVEPLTSHTNEGVRKAACTCLFELRRRSE